MRPQGAPVGMTVASDGAIWLVEDKNQTIMRIDAEPASDAVGPLPCDSRTRGADQRAAQPVGSDPDNRDRLTQVRDAN